MFARAGFASGDIEPYEFSDIDRTVAAGLPLSGKQWGRPDDTFGLAGVINRISVQHQAYLNAGGLGILVGDGKLPTRAPKRSSRCITASRFASWRVTLDYQFIVNPAYNRDRGPVSVSERVCVRNSDVNRFHLFKLVLLFSSVSIADASPPELSYKCKGGQSMDARFEPGRVRSTWCGTCFAATLLAILWAGTSARAQTEVDLHLIFAVDASGSVNQYRFELQKRGYVAALRNPKVLLAILGGRTQSIAVSLFPVDRAVSPSSGVTMDAAQE